ncbi:pachytene checkpoint protein 2 homolog [Eurytemora carolleeae]|uniref:pachytene checkpoint protein 2 homolog n=1 Tax=Eurytemora carolleeae TaxID=1294199 RepID=UPI000C770AB3|nr:pachytene checkpoint protein 2 homolog [Eurytemora carolleeae]|eukprot:XP_023336092.1 pachytene checkpoint protein 2 homolog [Eurytemora affinis]
MSPLRVGPVSMEVGDMKDTMCSCAAKKDVACQCNESIVVEVVQKDNSAMQKDLLKAGVDAYIRANQGFSFLFPTTEFSDPYIKQHVESIRICVEDESRLKDSTKLNLQKAKLEYRIFKLSKGGPDTEEISCEDGGSSIPAASHWILPSKDFQGMWESLVYDSNIKNDLLRFVETTLILGDKKVDPNVISCNRVVLLHGPPGTGKTSLCQALAQKLSIRMGNRYSHGQLVEINSHSLFSKWFSESGKLVQKMFAEIRDLIDDPNAFVCVLIDEVESLTAARKNSGSEPSDAIRVVNALLTQLDSIKHYPNLLILTTSNITGAIDLAFVDRADIKQYIGPPSQPAIYKIYYSCILELIRTRIVLMLNQCILPVQTMVAQHCKDESSASMILWNIAGQSTGMSGRTLRKLPLVALAMYCDLQSSLDIITFLEALQKALNKQLEDREVLSKQ